MPDCVWLTVLTVREYKKSVWLSRPSVLVILKYQKNLVSICIDIFMKSNDNIDTRIDTCAIQHYN